MFPAKSGADKIRHWQEACTLPHSTLGLVLLLVTDSESAIYLLLMLVASQKIHLQGVPIPVGGLVATPH